VAFFTKFFGRTVSEGAAFALGVATAPVLAPAVRELQNEANALHAVVPPDVGVLAAGVAQGQVDEAQARDWAKQRGYGDPQFDALVAIADNGPGLPQLFEAWRRDLIGDDEFTLGLKRLSIEDQWVPALHALKGRLLSLSELANARQQGFVDETQQKSESDLQGLDAGRAEILFQLSGLPLGVETMQQALNRGLIDRVTFDQAIREGHTKTKYTSLAAQLAKPVLHATDYAGLHLRGWITETEMNTGGALSGYSPEHMHLLYLNRGRPAAPGQMATAAARGIDGPAGTPMDRAQFLKGIAESDIRPEWGPMLWEARFLYPPLFQLTRLVQGGAIDPATAADWATKDRYPPEVVSALLAYWQSPTAAKADPHLAKAQTQLWTTTHRSYLSGESDDQVASAALAEAGVTAPTIPQVIALWSHERDLIRKQLTPAQVKKAYIKAVVNEATGQPWTKDDALAGLLERGYSHTDATTFLDE